MEPMAQPPDDPLDMTSGRARRIYAGLQDYRPASLRLWLEFGAFFIVTPLLIALFLPPRLMFAALFGFTLVGLGLLAATGYKGRRLITGWHRINWGFAALFTVAVGLTGWAIVEVTRPDAMRPFSPERLKFLAVLWVLYPLLSALPQELLFRTLFFHRYGAIFPSPLVATIVNAGVFSLAHLMYWSVIVSLMTFAGGLLFAISYLRRGFPSAWLLHALAGNMLFAVGMGAYFWSGNVVRPF